MDAEDFVTYIGSSTVIGCDDGITVVMPSKVMSISDFQLAELSKFAPENVNGTRGNNRATQPRDLQSFPVFEKDSKMMHHDKMHKMKDHEKKGMMGGMHDMMSMMMGDMMMMGASSIMASTTLAAAIAVAAF